MSVCSPSHSGRFQHVTHLVSHFQYACTDSKILMYIALIYVPQHHRMQWCRGVMLSSDHILSQHHSQSSPVSCPDHTPKVWSGHLSLNPPMPLCSGSILCLGIQAFKAHSAVFLQHLTHGVSCPDLQKSL